MVITNHWYKFSTLYPAKKARVYKPHNRMTDELVKEIKTSLKTKTVLEVAAKYKKSPTTIYNINNGTTYGNVEI